MSTTTAPNTERLDAGSALHTVRRGLRLSPELRRGLTVTVLLALVATAGRVVVPIAVQQTIDNGLGIGAGTTAVDLPLVVRAVLWASLAVLVTALSTGAMNIRLATAVETALANLRVRTFGHIHDLSMLHQASEHRGNLVARVTSDVDEVSRFMQRGGLNLLTASAQLVVAAVVMLVYSWRLTIVVLVLFVPFVLAAKWFQGRLTVAYTDVRERLGILLGRLAEVVVGAPVIRAYGIEHSIQERLDDAIEDHTDAALRAGRLSALFSGTGESFSGAATAAVVVAGVVFVGLGAETPGTVVAMLFLISLFVEPVQIAAETVNEGQTAVAGWRRVLDVLDVAPDVADPGEDGLVLDDAPVGVTFTSVGFRYPRPGETAREASSPTVLEDITVSIPPEQHVAVVGETGSGKTTFAKLLTRLMDPSTGTVEVQGRPIDRVAFGSLRRHVVMVPQEGALFAGTVRDNLLQGEPDATSDQLWSALDDLGLADWVASLPDGLDTPVGDRGGALSAGERQLVALARAYVADPRLLVLDEATSAVDPATEVRLRRALDGLTRGRTTVTIAHRLSTAQSSQRVLVFDHGRLVEDGHHDDLVAAGGVYADLYDSWEAGTAGRAPTG
ncbi:ABC transporter ATP-binding protein [Salsipaludibacter albus]|uniref:ABC transporter ATP-binding protein n=1 Tax=Salsipaludibacter albus TaxID=2849650 RepID=UPI001EE43418|nr:ABC transporter ATP-binding protein [Salsipaludibacter albus]MBY5162250.1 ABC transporter ATP-binding protein/permease [Salsipaludibacter albus]